MEPYYRVLTFLEGKKVEAVTDFIVMGSKKILQIVTATMELKGLLKKVKEES